MAQIALPRVSAEQYLAREAEATERSEFRDGVVVAMSGGSLNHGRLVHALGAELRNATREGSCESFGPEIKLRVEVANAYYYPDAMVVCGPVDVESETDGIVRNPVAVFEVLSPGTRRFDRNVKFIDYQSVPSIREVIFLWSDRRLAERYERQDDESWRYIAYVGAAALPVRAAKLELSLDEIYARLEF